MPGQLRGDLSVLVSRFITPRRIILMLDCFSLYLPRIITKIYFLMYLFNINSTKITRLLTGPFLRAIRRKKNEVKGTEEKEFLRMCLEDIITACEKNKSQLTLR